MRPLCSRSPLSIRKAGRAICSKTWSFFPSVCCLGPGRQIQPRWNLPLLLHPWAQWALFGVPQHWGLCPRELHTATCVPEAWCWLLVLCHLPEGLTRAHGAQVKWHIEGQAWEDRWAAGHLQGPSCSGGGVLLLCPPFPEDSAPCPQLLWSWLLWVKILSFKSWAPKMGDRSWGLSETCACCLLRYHPRVPNQAK